MKPRRLGDISLARILEREEPSFVATQLIPNATKEALEPYRSWLEPRALDPATGLLILPIQTYVVRTRHHNILIDTCLGEDKTVRWHGPWHKLKGLSFLRDLATLGLRPEDIHYVLCTHLHADHVGWNTRLVGGRWVPTFPNARYLFARQEWEHWERAELRARYTTDPYYEDSLLPVMESGWAQLVASDYAFDDSVWIEPWPGHTPGHGCVIARSPQGSVILSGYIMHTALQCAEPQLNSCFCVDPEAARTTRRRFLEPSSTA